MKSIFLLAIPILVLFVPLVDATGAARDYDEKYEDVPGECWYDGYQDGLNNAFNEERNEECKDKGDQYTRAFNVAIDICFNDREDDDGGDCQDAREEADS